MTIPHVVGASSMHRPGTRFAGGGLTDNPVEMVVAIQGSSSYMNPYHRHLNRAPVLPVSRSQPIPFIQGNLASDDSFDLPNHHAKLWNRVFIVRW